MSVLPFSGQQNSAAEVYHKQYEAASKTIPLLTKI